MQYKLLVTYQNENCDDFITLVLLFPIPIFTITYTGSYVHYLIIL